MVRDTLEFEYNAWFSTWDLDVMIKACCRYLESAWILFFLYEPCFFLHHKCAHTLLDFFLKTICQNILEFPFSVYNAISDSSDAHVSVYMLETHVMSQSALYTKKTKASVTCDNGSWIQWWQPCCFSRKRDGPSSPLSRREVEWHLYYGDAKYTMVQRHNAEALHSLLCSVTLFREWGSTRRRLSHRNTEKLCEKVQFYCLLLLRLRPHVILHLRHSSTTVSCLLVLSNSESMRITFFITLCHAMT